MYDPVDERAEELYASLLHLLKNIPERLGKETICSLLEEQALLSVLLEEAGGAPPEGMEREEAFDRLWDRVEAERDRRASALLHAVQSREF